MAKEDKFADEIMSDDELDNVAGGTRRELQYDAAELQKRGLLPNGCYIGQAIDVLHKMGYTGYQANFRENVYTDKSGNVISREQFWKNFDAENGTQIVKPSIKSWFEKTQ
ncbi:MAG: hypothetical protein IKT98_08735 [Selenomonadaceae bacterium]|nr:hypothetical protein [Selenomonadaceae bacterium]